MSPELLGTGRALRLQLLTRLAVPGLNPPVTAYRVAFFTHKRLVFQHDCFPCEPLFNAEFIQ